MNERMKNIIEDFEKNQIGPDEPFKFHCTMCGKCCINREDILLTPRDMYNLAKELNMTSQAGIWQEGLSTKRRNYPSKFEFNYCK